MGKETKADAVEELEEMLGMNDGADQNDDGAEADASEAADTDGETADADKALEEQAASDFVAAVSKDQADVAKKIIKIDVQIEELSKQTVDVASFYDNLDTHLSEEEQALEFEDKAAYMKLVAQKAKEYESANSPEPKIKALEDQKAELQSIHERQSALVEISRKYPSYDHVKMIEFFEKKLNKEQQDEIFAQSKTYYDVYENTFKLFAQSNKTNIKTQNVPNLPNLNNARRHAVDAAAVDAGLTGEDEKLRAALGI